MKYLFHDGKPRCFLIYGSLCPERRLMLLSLCGDLILSDDTLIQPFIDVLNECDRIFAQYGHFLGDLDLKLMWLRLASS